MFYQNPNLRIPGKLIIKWPKETMNKFYGINKDYDVEIPQAPIKDNFPDCVTGSVDFDTFATMRKIALG